jgi:mRNA-degrading endonuclease YafQ of YafQ-DinJ toxin-antitoxin module
MIEIVWDEKFKRIYKKWSKKHPDLVNSFRVKMEPHSLSGILKGLWSLRISYEFRLIFRFVDNEKSKVLLIAIGTHEEVY